MKNIFSHYVGSTCQEPTGWFVKWQLIISWYSHHNFNIITLVYKKKKKKKKKVGEFYNQRATFTIHNRWLKRHLESYFIVFVSLLSQTITSYAPQSIVITRETWQKNVRKKASNHIFSSNKSSKVVLTAHFGSSATKVGERPRYNPLKPSVLNMSFRLVIMTLPECRPKRRAWITFNDQ
jgi:hypothetical protein